MATRTLSLVAFRQSARQRAHFAIFVPSDVGSRRGTLIHVVGAPMAGYTLEFKRNYCPEESTQPHSIVAIGAVYSENIADSVGDVQSVDSTPRGNVERAAAQVPPPRISQNFMAPVNNTTNRRCQEWTTDYVRRLVELGYIGEDALNIVESRRDPPSHGIGLQGAGRGRGGGQAAAPQLSTQQASWLAASQTVGEESSPWVWDSTYNRYRRWDGAQWIWQ